MLYLAKALYRDRPEGREVLISTEDVIKLLQSEKDTCESGIRLRESDWAYVEQHVKTWKTKGALLDDLKGCLPENEIVDDEVFPESAQSVPPSLDSGLTPPSEELQGHSVASTAVPASTRREHSPVIRVRKPLRRDE
jgi:hypothetical protein